MPKNGQVDGVVVVRARCQCAVEHDLSGGDARDAVRLAQGERVLGQRAGLVGAQYVDAGEFLDRDQPADDRLLFGEQPRRRPS